MLMQDAAMKKLRGTARKSSQRFPPQGAACTTQNTRDLPGTSQAANDAVKAIRAL
jgi:hypothetical protein